MGRRHWHPSPRPGQGPGRGRHVGRDRHRRHPLDHGHNEQAAAAAVGGRLATPLLGLLDEVANTVRWRELPARYSHYGSRGIVLYSFLQSPSQAVQIWGREGWGTLWGAGNLRVYAGGVVDEGFLESLSKLCGDHDVPKQSVHTAAGAGQRGSRTWATEKEPIFTVADLAALPRGRALVLASGAGPKLVELRPWFEDRPLADLVRSAGRRATGAGS